MRNIDVSTKVFSKIWSFRIEGEETEDEILQRVLFEIDTEKEEPLFQAEVRLERRKRSKVLWRDDIVEALGRLGGEADLDEIYRGVEQIRKKAGRSLPVSTDAVIRRELENNSSDSESFTGHRNLFRSVNGIGGGRWALRE